MKIPITAVLLFAVFVLTSCGVDDDESSNTFPAPTGVKVTWNVDGTG